MFTWLYINSGIRKTGEEKRRYICKDMGKMSNFFFFSWHISLSYLSPDYLLRRAIKMQH